MSHNQGFKEPTSTKMGRRGRVMETGRDTVWRGEAVVAVVEQTVPHSHMVDKNQEGYLGGQ